MSNPTLLSNKGPRNENPLYNTQAPPTGGWAQRYPQQPNYCPQCPINVRYKTLPEGWPMETVVKGPTTIKSLYEGPLSYPYQRIQRPINTMYSQDWYDSDFPGQLHSTSGVKLYPFTHRYVREVNEYRGDILPYPSIVRWSSNPIIDTVKQYLKQNDSEYNKKVAFQALG